MSKNMCVHYAGGGTLIFDSDVLIWFLRGNINARQKVLANSPFKISAVTYMELVQGMKDKHELAVLKKTLANLDVEIIHINRTISECATDYVEAFFLSNSIEMGDALIAATCIQNSDVLCTANDKHYKAVPGLMMDVFRP